MTTALLPLLLCTVFYWSTAQVRQPPACPVLARPKSCSGVSNQCNKDSDCPVFTRCCWNGCTNLCVDTSSNIYTIRSKFGSCPTLDMNKKCTAMYDLCLDDSYCLGDEKCCMDRDCGRKCMLPYMLQKVKNSTRAFNCPSIKPGNSKCPHRPKNYCIMDAECPTFTTCCFDGCKRRCTDRQGRMVPNKKGSLCPVLPPPVACPYSFKECYNDNNCGMGLKCCSDTCNYWCMPSHSPPGASVPDPAPAPDPDPDKTSFRNLHKPGRCPVLSKPKSCEGQIFQCNYDVDCWNSDRKCCDNGCATKCVDPVTTTATQYVDLFTTATTTIKTGKRKTTQVPSTHRSSTQIHTTKTPTTKASTRKTEAKKTASPQLPPTQASTRESRTEKTKSPQLPPTQAPRIPTTTKITTEKSTKEATTVNVHTTEEPDTPSLLPEVSTRALKTVEPIETTIKKLDSTSSSPEEVTTNSPKKTPVMSIATVRPWIVPPTKAITPVKDGIRVSPESYEGQSGENIKVTCTIKGEPFEGWYTPKGLKVTLEEDRSMCVRGGGYEYTLFINNVGYMHGGMYTCRGAFTSANYELNIKLYIEAPNKKQFLHAGTTGIIKISARGYPRPKSNWIKDGYPISLSSGRYSIDPSGSLAIKNVDLSDQGHYFITADHYYKKTHDGFYSSVVGNSESAEIAVEIIRGECPMPKVRFCKLNPRNECDSDEDCTASICCYNGCKNTCILTGKPKSSYCPYLHPPSKCSSTLKQCSSNDQCPGKQRCCSDSCHVRCVHSRSSNSEIIPGVQTYPSVKSFCNPQQSIRLVCRIDKQPFNGWFDTYGSKVLPKTHGEKMAVENHGEYQVLIINNMSAKDGGKYTCQAGLDSAFVEISVNQTVAEYEHPIMLYPGHPGLLLQNIQCYPVPRFIWYRRGKPLDMSSGRYSVSPSGSLGIRRIRSSDMGIYTLKLGMGEHMKNTGVNVAAAVDGVDFTEWQDSLAPGASVRCQKDVMYIDLERKVLSDYSAMDLSLKNTSCGATYNKTHYTLKSPLVGCGTEVQFTEEAIVYSNVVREYRKDGIITRIQDIRIPFSCFYTKEGVTSTFGLLPTKVRRVLDGGNVTTKFELGMTLYRDYSYTVSFGVGDFPLRVTINRPLFIEVKIDSPDERLTVMSERCYATPTQDSRHPMQYDIISDGCAVDPTVNYYKGPHTAQRFSFKAFQFLAKGKQFVYLHCNLLVCNITDTTSRCSQGCISSFGRLKRAAPQDSTEVELTQGPFILEKQPVVQEQHSGTSFKNYVWIMVGMAGFCILCLLAMVYMKKQIHLHSQQTTPDPDRETNV